MFANPLVIPTLILAVILFIFGQALAKKVNSCRGWWWLMVLFAVLCLPGLSFITCYLHLVRDPLWYLEFRSMPYCEVLSACWGLLFGFIVGKWPERGRLAYPLFIIGMLLAFVPFAKSILLPAEISGRLTDNWQRNVCLQSGGPTCGPASLATIFSAYEMRKTQREIAVASFACARSTESWYLVRYARRCGFRSVYLNELNLTRIPTPAILGTGAERAGHFVVLFSAKDGKVSIGDPLHGSMEMTEDKFLGSYGFHGFAIAVQKLSEIDTHFR